MPNSPQAAAEMPVTAGLVRDLGSKNSDRCPGIQPKMTVCPLFASRVALPASHLSAWLLCLSKRVATGDSSRVGFACFSNSLICVGFVPLCSHRQAKTDRRRHRHGSPVTCWLVRTRKLFCWKVELTSLRLTRRAPAVLQASCPSRDAPGPSQPAPRGTRPASD